MDEGESLKRCLCIGYSTIETQEVDRIGYNGFLFPHEYSGEGRLHLSTHAEKESDFT